MSGEVKRGGGLLERLDDVKLVWKAAVALAFLVAGIAAVVWVARDGFKTQRYHMSNIYEFMLIPIADLGSGQVAAGDAQLALERIATDGGDPAALKAAQDAEEKVKGVVERYNTEWVTTVSAPFTQTLKDLGRLDLQQQELAILERLNTAHTAAIEGLAAAGTAVTGAAAGAAQAQSGYRDVASTLQELIDVNSEFGAISFKEANRANDASRRLIWIVVAASLVLGLFLAGLLISSTVRRLRRLTIAASRMRDGDLTQASGVVGRDEVGTVGQALDEAMAGLRESAERDRAEMARTAAVAGVVSEVSGFAQRLAQGDLTARLSAAEQADLTRMVSDLNAMVSGLSRLSTQVRTVSSELSSSSHQILSAVTQHTAATNEQAASISESAATADELRATAEQASKRADDVAERARRAVTVSDEGLDALDDLVSAIGVIGARVAQISSDIQALSDRTQQIDAITQTVSDIADQSNMLALNATIEAAKAGEQGRGFAVVADEVRRLSEQSKVATEQVREILRQISDGTTAAVRATDEGTAAVESGAQRLTRASTALAQLRVTVMETSEAAGAIGASVREQNVGMNQIASALDDVAKTTSQMSAGAEQVLREAQRLAGLAEQLDEATASYRVGTEDSAAARAPG